MDLKAQLEESFDTFKDWLQEQEWFQQLKQKWEELDAPSQTGIKIGSAGLGVILVFVFIFSFILKVHGLKHEVSEKQDLLAIIQNSGDELKRLKEVSSSATAAAGTVTGDWSDYLASQAGTIGLDRQSVSVANTKAGPATDQAKESLIDVTLKHATVRQIVRFALGLETGTRPVKVRTLTVDTGGDLGGYMDASLSLSAFSIIQPK